MLLTEKVIVKWNSKNKKWYEDKGYIFTKMKDEFDIKVEDLTDGSHVKVQVKCDCQDCKNPYLKPMLWNVYLKCVKEDDKYCCQRCALRLYGIKNTNKTKLKNGISFEQWCCDNLTKEESEKILSRWDYELNKYNPDEVTYGSSRKKYYFKCPRGIHKSELKNIASFTNGQEGSIQCNQCNSFAQWGIDNLGEGFLEKYWDYEKNEELGINPWEISYSCNKPKIWIKCQEKNYHESYDISCNSFASGRRCGFCKGVRVHPNDSIGRYIIDKYSEEFLKLVWSGNNIKSSYEYSPFSNEEVWWKCAEGKHEDYYRTISDANVKEFRCSDCVRERKESFLQEKVRLYLNELGYTVFHEHKCNIVAQNPKTKKGHMPYDNEVVELKLIIEIHGIQHYKINPWQIHASINNDTTPEYELHMQQVRDRYKRIFAKRKGYNYLAIPYWTNNEQEEWKQLIDNKIKKIQNNIK